MAEPAGADCAVTTDAPTNVWIWCAELEDGSTVDRNAFSASAFVNARVFANTGDDTTNEMEWRAWNRLHVSYCCTPRR